MRALGEQQAIEAIAERLTAMYPVPAETVEKVVHDAYARFNGRPVRSYIPLFVERDAKAQLAGLTS